MSTLEERERRAAYMRTWLAKNKDRVNAARRERIKSDPVYREGYNIRGRERYHARSPEVNRARHRKYRNEHRQWHRDASKKYYWRNLEKQHAKARIKTERRRIKRIDAYIASHGFPPPPKIDPCPGLVGEERAKEIERLYGIRYRTKNKEKIVVRNRKYRKGLGHKELMYQRTRRARKRGAPGKITPEQWDGIKNLYSNRCVCCGEEKPLEAEHIIPITREGTSNYSFNIQPMCGTCNKKKMRNLIDYRPMFFNRFPPIELGGFAD